MICSSTCKRRLSTRHRRIFPSSGSDNLLCWTAAMPRPPAPSPTRSCSFRRGLTPSWRAYSTTEDSQHGLIVYRTNYQTIRCRAPQNGAPGFSSAKSYRAHWPYTTFARSVAPRPRTSGKRSSSSRDRGTSLCSYRRSKGRDGAGKPFAYTAAALKYRDTAPSPTGRP